MHAFNLRVPSNLVAMVSRKVFCGASSPFRPGILARKNSSSGLNQASFPGSIFLSSLFFIGGADGRLAAKDNCSFHNR